MTQDFAVARTQFVAVAYGLEGAQSAPFGDFFHSFLSCPGCLPPGPIERTYGTETAGLWGGPPQCRLLVQRASGFCTTTGNTIVFGPEACGALWSDGTQMHGAANEFQGRTKRHRHSCENAVDRAT